VSQQAAAGSPGTVRAQLDVDREVGVVHGLPGVADDSSLEGVTDLGDVGVVAEVRP
jgi:hypothetical protein